MSIAFEVSGARWRTSSADADPLLAISIASLNLETDPAGCTATVALDIIKRFPFKCNERAALLLATTKNAKSYRERRKLARAARKGSIEASGKYREKRRDDLKAHSET